jgi:hypothetical protein
LLKLEKLVKKVIRKSLKNNTLEYTVQISTSSLEPGKLKYAAHISSPAAGVQPVTMVFDTFALLEAALEESVKEFNPQKVELAFHESRINSYNNKVKQHEQRVKVLTDPNYDPETDSVTEALKDLEKKSKEKTDEKVKNETAN